MPKLIKTEVNVEGRVSVQYAVVDGPDLAPWGENEELAIVGQPAPRIDGAARASGEARYTYDVLLPGMLWAGVLRSPHPHARVVSIDTSRAQALPGVVEIMTPDNMPPIKVRGGKQGLLASEPRFKGEAVVAVAASDPDVLADALKLIRVEYEELPFVSDPEAALAPDAPQVGPRGNILRGEPQREARGDVDAGFAEADVIVELTARTPTAAHNALETHGCVAQWEGDQLTLYESSQHVYGVRTFAADKLGLPISKVRAVGPFMGGGFGAKFPGGAYTLIAAELAKRSRRPVHLMYDREGENLEAGYRGASVQEVRMGAKRDGTLTAIQVRIVTELGSAANWIPAITGPYNMMYACPSVRTEVYGALTHVGPFAAFRAPGFVEGAVGLEAGMDALARKLGMDPLEFRRRNIPDRDQTEDKPFSSFPIEECYRRAAEAIGWSSRRSGANGRANGRYRRGLGMSSQIWWGGGGPPAYAEMQLNSDGTAVVVTGVQDLGTGARTICAQVGAEEFGLPLDKVSVVIGDTIGAPFGPGSGGSITTGSITPAVRQAANDLRGQVCDLVSQMHDIPEAEIEIRGGIVYRQDDEVISLEKLMGELGDVMLTGRGSRGPNADDVSVITSGVQFAEVEVDTVTGRVRVVRVVAAHDSGRIMNPQTFTSQIEGGVIQGLGVALVEDRVIDHRYGTVMNPDLEWYKLPTNADVPEIVNILIDIPDTRANTTGAKGAGEPGIIPTAAAIANAVADAIGMPITELPITPARVLEALERAESTATARRQAGGSGVSPEQSPVSNGGDVHE
jgi:xanthine dehydrogenase YagR molybdenum-binding subunit